MFATPEWFARVPVPLPTDMPAHPDFAVEHQATLPNGGTVVHQQLFRENQLVGWLPGRATSTPDLTLIRPIDCDAGDLLGRLTAAEIINNTTVTVGQHDPTCPLGITGMHRPGLDAVATRTVDIALEVSSTPFGDAELVIRLNPDGTQHLITSAEANHEITLQLQWPPFIEWLHTETRLGNLLNRGDLHIDGTIYILSYIEGHISWPPTPQGQQLSQDFSAAMNTYHQLRQTPAYLDLMDQIEEISST